LAFEQKMIGGIEWFVCNGQGHRSFRHAIDVLQNEYRGKGSPYVWGKAEGCWEALWLAEQYDVRVLVLEACSCVGGRAMRRISYRNTFAVVCPVIICDGFENCPELPNTQVYHAENAGQIQDVLRSLRCINAVNTNDL